MDLTDVVFEYTEEVSEELYEGTVIDTETNMRMWPICFGSLHRDQLSIIFLIEDTQEAWSQYAYAVLEKAKSLPRPFLAFNADFDEGVLSGFYQAPFIFDGEIQLVFKSKDRHAKDLGAPPIDDPLEGRSAEVPPTWDAFLDTGEQEYLDRIVFHNRACLLKEAYIAQQVGWTPRTTYAIEAPRHLAITTQNQQIQQLLEALNKQFIVAISYQDSRGEISQRDVAVLSLGKQYFRGYCYLREEFRTFKITRVTELEVSSNPFDVQYLLHQLTTQQEY